MLNDQEWHMPATNFYANPLEGIDLEIISLDTNILDAHKICPWIECGCFECPCPDDFDAVEDPKANRRKARLLAQRNFAAQQVDQKLELRYRGLQQFLGRCSHATCRTTLQKRAEAGFRMLEERIKAAEGTKRQLIVVTHYPTTWFKY